MATLVSGKLANETTSVRCGSNGFQIVDFLVTGSVVSSIESSNACTSSSTSSSSSTDSPSTIGDSTGTLAQTANTAISNTGTPGNILDTLTSFGFGDALEERSLLELTLTYLELLRSMASAETRASTDEGREGDFFRRGIVVAVLEDQLRARGIDPADVRRLGGAPPNALPVSNFRSTGASSFAPQDATAPPTSAVAALLRGSNGATQFRLDLNDLRAANAHAATKALGYGHAPTGIAARIPHPSRWNAWIVGTGSQFDDSRPTGTSGDIYSVAAGVSYLLSNRATLAAAARYRRAESDNATTRHEGDFYSGSVMAGVSLFHGIVSTIVAAFEHGDNDLTVGGASADFDSDAFVVAASARKRFWLRRGAWLEPNAEVSRAWTDRGGFTNTAGTTVAGTTINQGVAGLGVDAGLNIYAGSGGLAGIEPFASAKGLVEIARADGSERAGLSLQGGLRLHFRGQRNISLSGGYLRLGSDFESWNARGALNLPF